MNPVKIEHDCHKQKGKKSMMSIAIRTIFGVEITSTQISSSFTLTFLLPQVPSSVKKFVQYSLPYMRNHITQHIYTISPNSNHYVSYYFD